MWQQRLGWVFTTPIIAAALLVCIYILLPEQQLKWFLLTLILSAVILFLIGILIFYITKSLSKRVLGEEKRNVDIIFAGAIIVALSQLFGPLFGASYPLILGPDASNYKLSFSSMYYNITYDEISENYTFTSTDNNGTIEDYHFHRGELIRIHTNISAESKNPLMKYDDQIFLDLVPPANVTASIARPVIIVGQSSDVIIGLYNPNPGSYPIKVHGIGADGKTRDAMTVVAVSCKIGTRSYVPSGVFKIEKSIQRWGNSTSASISVDWQPCENPNSCNQPEIISQGQGNYSATQSNLYSPSGYFMNHMAR